MEIKKLYPSVSDEYSTDEITVVDGISAEILPTSTYNKARLLARFNEGVTTDSGPYANNLTHRAGNVTVFNDPVKGNVGLFDGSSSLVYSDATIFFGETYTDKLVVDLSYYRDSADTTDSELVSIRTNCLYIRLLLAGTTLYFQVFYNGGNFVKSFPTVTYDEWHKASFYLNYDGTAYNIRCWHDGSYQESLNVVLTAPTVAGYVMIGAGQEKLNPLTGRLENIYISNEVITPEELQNLHYNDVTKFPTQVIYTMNQDFTSSDLTKFLAFAESKTGAGSLAYNVSIDDGVTWLRWDIALSDWISSGSGYNTATTLNDNIQFLDAQNQKFRLKIAMISDGWQEVGFTEFQTTYAVNTTPNVDCNVPSFVILGNTWLPFAYALVSDIDSNLTNLYYQIDWEVSETPVSKGAYASFQEALRVITKDTTGQAVGMHSYTLRAVDALGAETIRTGVFYIEPDLETKLDSIISNLALVKTETDKIQTIDDNVDSTLTAVGNLNDFDPVNDVVAHVTLVDTTTTNTDMVVAPDNASINAIKTQTDKMNFVGTDIKSTLDGEVVDANIDLSSLALETSVQAIKTQTDKLQFSVSNDIKATLDGEVVDANIDLSSLALETSVQAVKTQTDKMNFVGTDIKSTLDGEAVNANVDVSGLALESSVQAGLTTLGAISTGLQSMSTLVTTNLDATVSSRASANDVDLSGILTSLGAITSTLDEFYDVYLGIRLKVVEGGVPYAYYKKTDGTIISKFRLNDFSNITSRIPE